MGLTPGTLAILIPVWSLGLIGLVLWVIGHPGPDPLIAFTRGKRKRGGLEHLTVSSVL